MCYCEYFCDAPVFGPLLLEILKLKLKLKANLWFRPIGYRSVQGTGGALAYKRVDRRRGAQRPGSPAASGGRLTLRCPRPRCGPETDSP